MSLGSLRPHPDQMLLEGPPVLLADLDGTVRWGHDELVVAGAPNEWVNGPDDVVLFDDAKIMMRRWRDVGGRVYGITNQGGIAAGHMSWADCAAAIRETVRQAHDDVGHLFDGVLMCGHGTDDGCFCRKPLPGMIFDAVSEVAEAWGRPVRSRCLMVGDRDEDRLAAGAAGVPFEDAATWRARATA